MANRKLKKISQQELACYLRVSSVKQFEKNISIPAQKKLAIQKAKTLGMTPVFYIEAKGVSSYKEENLENRPQMRRLLSDIKDGKITHLYSYDLSRLSRENGTTAILFSRIKKAKTILITNNAQLDLQNPNDRLQAGILNEFTQFETDVRVGRFRLGLMEVSRKGKYVGPNAPWGYFKNEKGFLKIDENEKRIYLEMVRWILQDKVGTYTIARRLNSRNIPTKSQKKGKDIIWNPGTVLSILKNSVYKGTRKYSGEDVDSPAIIDSETWQKIQKQISSNAYHRNGESNTHFHLLKGLIKCGCCGMNYYGKVKVNSQERLYCCLSKRKLNSKCGNKNINKDRIEFFIWGLVQHSKEYLKFWGEKLRSENNVMEIENEISELKSSLTNRSREYKFLLQRRGQNISLSAGKVIEEGILEKEKEMLLIEKDIQQLEAKSNSLALNEKNWDEAIQNGSLQLGDLEKRRLVLQLIDKIKINYSPKQQEHILEIKMLNMPESHSIFKARLSSKLLRAKQLKELKSNPLAYLRNLEYAVIEWVRASAS